MQLRREARPVAVAFVIVAVLATWLAASAAAHPEASPSVTTSVGMIASQLGVKPNSWKDEDFVPGVQFTGILEEPNKIAHFGIRGFHKGARVTVACVSTDRVFVDADELDPVPKRETARLHLDALGRLTLPPKT